MSSAPDNLPLVVVEPLARGSRLQLLANVIAALGHQRRIFVVTRSDYDTDHFRELILAPQLPCTIVTAPTDLGGIWTKILSLREFRLFLNQIRKLERVLATPYDLLWMALDEYLAAFAWTGLGGRGGCQPHRVFAIKWRVDYLRRLPASPRGLGLRILTRLGRVGWQAALLVFDERLAGAAGVRVVPDLWFGDFSPGHRALARRRRGFADDAYVALTIGRQDERKGFPLVISAIGPLLDRWPDLVLWVVGPVEARFQPAFARLQEQFGTARVRSDTDFVPEADLPHVFAAADVVLLPYAAHFTASSGVLPRAAASGVPVLASNHGLVGHRVLQWQLGETFPAGSVTDFQAALARLRRSRASFDGAGLADYARASSWAAFQSALAAALRETPQ